MKATADFQFVTVTHPREMNEEKTQKMIRRHAMRTSNARQRGESIKKSENFIMMNLTRKESVKGGSKRRVKQVQEVVKNPSSGKMDPFNTLPGNAERLRLLMSQRTARHAGEPVFCLNPAGTVFFQGLETVFQGALSDAALFHALSLILALAANKEKSNLECLLHRGEVLKNLRQRMGEPDQVLRVSTLSAMLLLIGYEYRVDGATCDSVRVHVEGVQGVIQLSASANISICPGIKRALFWQDLLSSLLVGTVRSLSYDFLSQQERVRDPNRTGTYAIPAGFCSAKHRLSSQFLTVLEDTNAVCTLIDANCSGDDLPINKMEIDNEQAWIECRLVSLLSHWRQLKGADKVYEACIFATYLCTYKLSTTIWNGSFVPAYCANQLLRILQSSRALSAWKHHPDLLLWLLFVGGALSDDWRLRVQFSALTLDVYADLVGDMHTDWSSTRHVMTRFVWSQHAMGRNFRAFWDELHAENNFVIT